MLTPALRAAALALALLALPAAARQDDPKLTELFDRLGKVDDGPAAKAMEAAIWSLWMHSGSDTVDLLLRRGTAAMSAGDHETALKLFDSVVKLDPNFAEGWNKRATLYFLMSDYPSSVADIERTLALEPRHFGALSGLGMIELELGREREALAAFEKALAVNPHLPGVKDQAAKLKKKLEGNKI
jgi:tetratricopeptide (TPR) repeat protein